MGHPPGTLMAPHLALSTAVHLLASVAGTTRQAGA